MNKIKNAVENLLKNLSNTKHPPSKVTNEMLLSEGLTGITPHDYQLYAIDWMTSSFVTRCEAGVIIGDEMGLGKTLQSVASLLHLKSSKTTSGPFLILSPLSVVDSWKKEFQRCAPPLEVFTYIGNKEEREIFRKDIETSYSLTNPSVMKSQTAPFDVLLTSYEVFLKDSCFLERFCWKVLIVDEAHRLKNHNSLLYRQLKEVDIGFKILLTGTPVQNNLTEIYSLLSFVAPNVFHLDNMQGFVDHFSNIVAGGSSSPTKQQELHNLLAPFLLRRVKNEVMKNLPKKSEVLLHCGMSEEQKNLYIAILTKDLGAFNNEGKTRLMNILMQLRKCCNHPYIFPGIEKEPYILGEHIVETSGKLHLLDKLLSFLKASGHKVLLFSQMTTMLDIIQDYLGYREYSYERLDGSVRGEERYLAVNNFNETKDTFIFLLSTRAGGQGLNLVSADTVIFIDNDFNPQNDLQAAARAHRIGQKRPVKIIRLVTKNSVEEIILKRAERKLKLTNVVVEGGQFSNLKNSATADELSSMLKFGLEEIMNHKNEGKFEEVDFESILGRTSNSEWEEISTVADQKPNNPVTDETTVENIYEYNGKDYAHEINDDDKNAFDKLIQDVTQDKERSLRKDPKSTAVFSLDTKKRKRRVLTEEEKEALKITREANKAKRIKLLEEKAIEKREKLWKSLNYTSYNVHLPDEESDDVISTCSDDDVIQQINYVIGDVTNPESRQQEAIVVHCVDDGGYWGNGGLFTAINKQSTFPKQQYELASKAQDLNLGDVHLVKMKESPAPTIYAGLLVVHSRDRKNRLSPLHLNHLNTALEKLSHVAKQTGAQVHFPRIGHNSANFNWYGIERLIKKCFTQRNIPTYVYYFKRTTPCLPSTTTQATTSTVQAHASVPGSSQLSPDSPSTADNLADIFTDCVVYLDSKLDDPTKRRISRYVVAYDGDVDKVVTEDTTHVVAKDDGDFSSDDIKCDVKIVGVSWVERCIKVGKRIPEEKYLIVKQ